MAEESKDQVIHVTKEEESERKPEENDENDQMSAVGPDGEIDWDCPCLAGMTTGPCGETFKDAFSCFVHSEEEQKGADCVQYFQALHDCLEENSSYYAKDDEEDGSESNQESINNTSEDTKDDNKTQQETTENVDKSAANGK